MKQAKVRRKDRSCTACLLSAAAAGVELPSSAEERLAKLEAAQGEADGRSAKLAEPHQLWGAGGGGGANVRAVGPARVAAS